MPIDTGAMLRVAEIVAQQENMKVAVKYSLTCAAVTGFMTLIGGIVAGPAGLAIGKYSNLNGGALGGVGSMLATDGKFKSLVEIIQQDLTYQQQHMLAQEINAVFQDVDVTDLIGITAVVMNNRNIYLSIADIIRNFFTSEMKMLIQ